MVVALFAACITGDFAIASGMPCTIGVNPAIKPAIVVNRVICSSKSFFCCWII
ncbi:MAG: hypothetical protein ACYT04_55280 [Nostoc sp.]